MAIKTTNTSGTPATIFTIDAGDLGINLPDGKMWVSDGVSVHEIGANLLSLSVGGSITANGSVGAAGQVLKSGGSGAPAYWGTVSGGSGGSPGGSNTSIQFNDDDSFAGDAGLTYNKTTDTLNVAGSVLVGANIVARSSVLVGANVFANTSALFVGNSSVNTIITGGSLDIGGDINANGSVGTAGQVLKSGGSGANAYWDTVGSGSPGGSTTQVQFNDSSSFAGDAGLTYNKSTDALTVAGSVLVGANVIANTSALLIGNSSVNTTYTSTLIQVANSTSTANLTATGLAIGVTTANTIGIFVGANVYANSSAFDVGNTIITTTNLTLGGQVTANGGVGSSGQVLTSGGSSANAYWGTVSGDSVSFLPAGSGAVQSTVQSKLREMVSAKDFGAVGNGVANDSSAINAAITAVNAAGGGTVYFPAGTYVASSIVMRSNVRLLGEGDGTIIRATTGMGNTTYIIINANVGTYTDTNIAIENLVIDGNGVGLGGAQARFAELVALVRVTGLVLRGVTVRNCGYIGIGLGSSRRILVDGCRFTTCGFDGATSNGGPALWIASTSTDYPEDVKVIGCEFYSNRWSGLHFSVVRGTVSGCTFRLNKEAHIFGSRLLPNTEMTYVTIDGNTFDDVTKKDISAHAIEVGGHFLVIKGNMIRNCDHGGIALTDTQNVVVEGNIITDVNRLAISAGCIDIITTSSVSNQPTNITISNNRLRAGSTSPIAAINVGGTGAAVTILSILGNNLNAEGTYSSGKAIRIVSGKATTPVIRDNWGFALDPIASEFQANSATGTQAVTGLGFRPRLIEFMAVLPSSTTQRMSHAVVASTGTAVCHGWSSDASSSASTTKGNKAWSLFAPNNVATIVHEASFVSFDDDGFTVNITTGGTQPFIRYVAYP